MFEYINSKAALKEYKFVPAGQFSHLQDSEIIRLVLSGNIQLFEVLMRRYNQRLYRVLHSYASDEEAIKDVLQLTYIKAFENLGSFRGEAQFSTWITRIAINEGLKFLDRKKRFSSLQLLEKKRRMKEESKYSFDSPEETAIQNDYKKLLEEVVGNLPPKYRSVYIMREIEDMDTRETSECLNITESNVKVRLHRSKQMIQDLLNQKLTDTEIFDFLGVQCDLIVYLVMTHINQAGTD